jgi:hypothetical protein
MILGIISGSRLGPDYRYHFPIFILTISLFLILYLYFWKDRTFVLLLISTIIITSYSFALEVRHRQQEIDAKIWNLIESKSNYESLDGFITYNPNTNYIMPPYHSFAESDFQADWGISGKYNWFNKRRVPIYYDIKCNSSFQCQTMDYSGTQSDIFNLNSKKFIYLYSQTQIDEAFINEDMFKVTSNYLEFKNFKDSNPKALN